jgi:3-oxoacyl-[acyl-carrier protein] reductase
MDVNGKTVLIVGAAGDLGRAILQELSGKAGHVIALDNNREKLDMLPEGITKIHCDASDVSDVAEKIPHIYHQHPTVDILINAAGILHSAPLVNILEKDDASVKKAAEDWQRCIAANLSATFYVSQWVARKMAQARTKGVIVNISSVSAAGNAGQSAYSASKAGVNALTHVWAKELALYGIRSVSIAPGYVDTPSTRKAVTEAQLKEITGRIPLRKLGQPDSIVQAVLFAIQNDYLNAAVLEIDGGLTI